MKKLMKSLLLGIISAGAIFSASSCVQNDSNTSSSTNTTNSKVTSSTNTTSSTIVSSEESSTIVRIKSLKAQGSNGTILGTKVYSPKALSYFDITTSEGDNVVSSEDEISSESSSENDETENIQYIVIYKSISQIKFTIKLDNPESYGIDAIRLACDDEAAQIKLDNEWKALSYDNGSRIVNWSSEDAYEKTYEIKLSSTEYLNTLTVKDIRLAGHQNFQSKETIVKDLGRNELKIYRMNESDIVWKTIYNKPTSQTTGEYCWKFETADNISDIEVEGLSANENGEYVITEDQTVKYTFYIKLGGAKLKWNFEKKIKVYEVGDTSNPALYFNKRLSVAISILATDYNSESVHILLDNKDIDRETFKVEHNSFEDYNYYISLRYDNINKDELPRKIEVIDYGITVKIINYTDIRFL